MTSVREAILASNRLAAMRAGQEAPHETTIPSKPEIRCSMVPLLEREAQRGVIRAAQLDVQDNAAGLQARNRAALESDVWHSLREPSDPATKVFETVEQMVDELDATDIDFLSDELSALMDYASPAIDGFSQEQLDDLKKAFGETDWSALTGWQWAALKLACQALFPNLLRARSLTSTSTESATTRNANDEST